MLAYMYVNQFCFLSGVESPYGDGIGNLSGQLSDLSIASGVSSEASSSLLSGGVDVGDDREGTMRHEDTSYRPHCCRSCKNFSLSIQALLHALHAKYGVISSF